METIKKFTVQNVTGFSWGFILGLNFLWNVSEDKKKPPRTSQIKNLSPENITQEIPKDQPQEIAQPQLIKQPLQQAAGISNEVKVIEPLPMTAFRQNTFADFELQEFSPLPPTANYRNFEFIMPPEQMAPQINILENTGEMSIIPNLLSVEPVIQGMTATFVFYTISISIPVSIYFYLRTFNAYYFGELVNIRQDLGDYVQNNVIPSGLPINENPELKLANEVGDRLDKLIEKVEDMNKKAKEKRDEHPATDQPVILDENLILPNVGKLLLENLVKDEAGTILTEEEGKEDVEEEREEKIENNEDLLQEVPVTITVNENIPLQEELVRQVQEIGESQIVVTRLIENNAGQQQEIQEIQNIAQIFNIQMPREYMQLDEGFRNALEDLAAGRGVIAGLRFLYSRVKKIENVNLRAQVEKILEIAEEKGFVLGSQPVSFIPFIYPVVYHTINRIDRGEALFDMPTYGDDVFREILVMPFFHYREHDNFYDIIRAIYERGDYPERLRGHLTNFLLQPTIYNFIKLHSEVFKVGLVVTDRSLDSEGNWRETTKPEKESADYRMLILFCKNISIVSRLYSTFYDSRGQFIPQMKIMAPIMINNFYFTVLADLYNYPGLIKSAVGGLRTRISKKGEIEVLGIGQIKYYDKPSDRKEMEIDIIKPIVRAIEILRSKNKNDYFITGFLISFLLRIKLRVETEINHGEPTSKGDLLRNNEAKQYLEFIKNILERFPYIPFQKERVASPNEIIRILGEELCEELYGMIQKIIEFQNPNFNYNPY